MSLAPLLRKPRKENLCSSLVNDLGRVLLALIHSAICLTWCTLPTMVARLFVEDCFIEALLFLLQLLNHVIIDLFLLLIEDLEAVFK